MGTTADKLNKLLETKAAIKNAIIAKGVEVADSDTFASYPAKIEAIEVGSGGSGSDYENPDFYEIRTKGGTNFKGLFAYATIEQIPDFSTWDASNVTDMTYMFYTCSNLTSLDLSNFDTSKVTDMNSMFYNCNNLTTLDVSSFDTGNVTDMNYMFNGCKALTSLDTSNFNTSKVTKMTYMFYSCQSLTTLNLSNFNTSNVTDMNYMFYGCSNLTSLDISNFDTSKATKMNSMFYKCSSLHTLRLDNCTNDTINKIISSSSFPTNAIEGVTRKIYVNPDNLGDLETPNGWIFVDSDGNEIVPEPEIYQVGYYKDKSDIIEATTMVNNTHTDLSYMFKGCIGLATINNIDQWDTSNVTDMESMFEGCIILTPLDLSSFNTSNVTNMTNMFYRCYSLETLNISNFDMSKVEYTDFMFDSCNNLQQLRLDNCSAETVEKIINSEGFPTGEVAWEKRIMYVNSKAADVLMPIDGWIFVDCETLKEIEVKEPASPYEEGQFAKNTDITVANTLVTKEHEYLDGMFGGCTNLAVVDTSDWDTSNVVSMSGMFSGCENLPYLDLSHFDTSNVTNMIDMFKGCTDLLYLDISNFTVEEGCDTGKYDDSGMFLNCTSLLDLRLDNCDTDTINRIINSNGFPTGDVNGRPRVIYVREKSKGDLSAPDGSVFGYIEDPVYITNKDDKTKWDYIDGKEVVNVIVDTQTDLDRYEDNNLERLFENCGSLRLINGIEQWNTTGIEYMVGMFAGCTHLVSLNLSSFDISNAHNIYNMFEGCTNLRYLDISNFIMGEESHFYNTNDMFRFCDNLRHLRLDNCDRNTIEKIINDSNLPMGDIDGEKRKIYVQEANVDGLTPRDGWEFIYLVEVKKEEE